MKITIYGSGYVGLITGACMSHVGNQVLCVDIDADKVSKLNILEGIYVDEYIVLQKNSFFLDGLNRAK